MSSFYALKQANTGVCWRRVTLGAVKLCDERLWIGLLEGLFSIQLQLIGLEG